MRSQKQSFFLIPLLFATIFIPVALQAQSEEVEFEEVFVEYPTAGHVFSWLTMMGAGYDDSLNVTTSATGINPTQCAMKMGRLTSTMNYQLIARKKFTDEQLNALSQLGKCVADYNMFDANFVHRMKSNLGNMDSSELILAEGCWYYQDFDEGQDVATGISVFFNFGVWIEINYVLACVAIGEKNEDHQLRNEVKVFMGMQEVFIQQLMDDLKKSGESSEADLLLPHLSELEKIFSEIKVVHGESTVEEDIDTGVTTISSENSAEISKETLEKIFKKVREIRNAIIWG